MLKQLMIIDDFLADPLAAREAALKMTYDTRALGDRGYIGRNSKQRLIIPELMETLSLLVGSKLVPSEGDAHAKCRITLEEDSKDRALGVHIDPSVHWSGILFLSKPEDCQGGTGFYKHKRLGTDRAPIYAHELKEHGYSKFEDVADDVLMDSHVRDDDWEELMTVPMKFNRLILLRPWLWHTAGRGFGDCLENGRLVNLLFMRQLDDQG